jgi:protein phosphatase 2C
MISKTHEPDQQLQWEKLMTDCFSKIDREVGGICPSGMCYDRLSENICNSCDDAISPENVGTTAVIAVVGPCQIVLANCGDSRAVLSRGGKTVSLSNDHKVKYFMPT